MKLPIVVTIFFLVFAGLAFGQRPVTFLLADKSAKIQADLYGEGDRAVILAHGGRFHKESWKKQAQVLAKSGFLVMAIGFRGDGFNPDGSPGALGSTAENTADVLAGIAYLRENGATSVSAVGASLGGDAVGEADAQSAPGNIDRIVLLGSDGGGHAEKFTGRKLFIVGREDSNGAGLRLNGISKNYAKANEPKKLIVVEGSAHAQFLFDTDQGPRVLDEILQFLLSR